MKALGLEMQINEKTPIFPHFCVEVDFKTLKNILCEAIVCGF